MFREKQTESSFAQGHTGKSIRTMKNRLLMLLKKIPFLYTLVTKIYYNFRLSLFLEYIVGTKAREREWEARNQRKDNFWGNSIEANSNNDWVMGYWNSREHSHRSALLSNIESFTPISSALEFGCNCGPNLYLLAKKYPRIELTGIDINASAIEKGKQLFASEGIDTVKLITGGINDLKQFPDNSFDVVFTDAVLIYIGKDVIENVVKEMLRIARKGLVLAERHVSGKKNQNRARLGIRSLGFWHRDYSALLESFVSSDNISITKMNEDIWADPCWQKSGAFIKVTINRE